MSNEKFKETLMKAIAEVLHGHTESIKTHIDELKNAGYDLNDLEINHYLTDDTYITELICGEHKRTITNNTVIQVGNKRNN